MLANSFLKAEALGITEVEVAALVKVLGMLERGEIVHGDAKAPQQFSMAEVSRTDCGTLACLCGWAHAVSRGSAFPEVGVYLGGETMPTKRFPPAVFDLFGFSRPAFQLWDIKPAQAAVALRNFLTTGEPNWADALAES